MPEGGYRAVIVNYAQLSDQTYEHAIGCLPSVADMCQQNVIDFAKARENQAIATAIEAKNAQ